MNPTELVLLLRSASRDRSPSELAQILDDHLSTGLTQSAMVFYFKQAFPETPLRVLLEAGAWSRLTGGELSTEQFDELLAAQMTYIEPVPDRDALAGALREAFPAYRDAVDRLVAEIAEYGGFSEYSLLSEVFRWGVLEAAVESGAEERIRAAYEFIERLLGSPDQSLRDPTVIRVVKYLLQDPKWAAVTRRHAGRYLAEELDRYTGDQDWRHERC